MDQTFDLGRINRRAYASLQAKRQYSKARGYLDHGEFLALQYVADHCYLPDVLDIGVGGGRTIPLIKRFSGTYIGIDYIGDLIKVCRRRFPGENLVEMDARKLEFGNKSFDVVNFSNNGIDSVNFQDRERILQEVYKVLRPCGFFVFSALNYHGREPYHARRALGRVKDIVSAPVSLINRRRLRKYNTDNGIAATKTLNAHFCGLVATHMSITAQAQQLIQGPFYLELILNVFGEPVNYSVDTCDSPYVHYIVRKPIPI
jgi:SAM-dependent methyltransferase